MKEIYIKSAKAIVKVLADSSLIEKILEEKFLYSYIPSCEVLYEGGEDATIIFKKGKNNLILDYPNIEYIYEYENIKDMIAFIEYILERARLEYGIICIHGAGAVINNELIISWGTTTGMGKTTLALELAKNGSIYSDEKILIDLNAMKSVGRIKYQYISNDYWKNKEGDDYFKEMGNISLKEEYPIKLFVQPIICDSANYTLDEWNKDKFLWHIYEETSRKIRGTSRIVFDNTYPVISLDTLELAKKRLELLKEFTSKVKAIYYKGNIDNILEIIKKQS